uniref:Uncharacterized protein n=1 Tax=Caenorhabditis japonica TaxID=281687 RepID=A0A8R1E939_CAEJA
MPSIWRKLNEYTTWFLWGKIPYSQLNAVEKQDARRDLYFRLFLIANAPICAAFYVTFVISIYPSMWLSDGLCRVLPESLKKPTKIVCFAIYASLNIVSFSVSYIYFIIPCYKFVFTKLFSLDYDYES